jgi:hypothetical protein
MCSDAAGPKSTVLNDTLRSSTTCFLHFATTDDLLPPLHDDDENNAAVAMAVGLFPSWPPPAVDRPCSTA